MSALRYEVKRVYKELLFLGREYPLGYEHYRSRLHDAFMKKARLSDEGEIQKGLEFAEFFRKEVETLYYLKRYRTLRKRYVPGA